MDFFSIIISYLVQLLTPANFYIWVQIWLILVFVGFVRVAS